MLRWLAVHAFWILVQLGAMGCVPGRYRWCRVRFVYWAAWVRYTVGGREGGCEYTGMAREQQHRSQQGPFPGSMHCSRTCGVWRCAARGPVKLPPMFGPKIADLGVKIC